jgi:hypothetical protein
MQKFDLHIRVLSAEKLATIVQVLDGEALLMKMEAVTRDDDHRPRQSPHYLNGKRLKGILGRDLFLLTMADGKEHSRRELEKAFTSMGFHSHSHSSQASMLKQQQMVEITETGWKLTAKGAVEAAKVRAAAAAAKK